MATFSSLRGISHRWALTDLSSELIALIIGHLLSVDKSSVVAVRRVCRRIDAIATPISYRVLALNENIVAPYAAFKYPNLFQNVAIHTNHVVARSNLDPVGTKTVLDHVQRLQSIRWCYVGPDLFTGAHWLPSDVLDPQRARLQRTRLHVEGLPLLEFEGSLSDTYLRAIPTDILTTLKLASPAPPLTTRLNSLKHLILRSAELETFHYEDRGQGTQFKFKADEKMPPFKDLRFKSYDWNHSREEVAQNWDLTRLESLELIMVPIFNFLSSVDMTHLCSLRRLCCEDYSAHLPIDKRHEATQGLYILVKHHIRALQTLSITCHIHAFPLDALLAHAPTLQVLRFRDHVGFGEEDRRCPTLWPGDLATLSRRLCHLHTLEVDMDVALCDPVDFLTAICAFPNLRTLVLHVQTVLQPLEAIHPGVDRDHDAAVRTLNFLIQRKAELAAAAAAAGKLSGSGMGAGHFGAPSWNHITINVGGWKRVMVRRFSTAWRNHNMNGVFAERCFVFERVSSDGDAGPYMTTFREERAVETRSSTPTPERMLG